MIHGDLPGTSGVPARVSRPLVRAQGLVAVLVAAVLAACGSKDKKVAAAPGEAAAGDGSGAQGDGSGAQGDGDGEGEPGSGDGAPGDGESADTAGGPGVRPPGLDLPPAEKQRRVSEHLKRAQQAIDSSNDPNFAITESKAALAVDETSVDAMVILAHAYYMKGYYDLVQDVLEKALARKGEKNKKLHFLFGLIHDRAKRNDLALDSYQKAVALDPSYKSALMNLGVHLLRNKRFQEAVTTYERLTGELNYKSASAYANLGSGYRGLSAEFTATDVNKRNQLLLKAERAYKQSLNANKNYANAYYNMGLLYLDADPFPEGKNDMDLIKRLQRAKAQFDEYRRLPGADQKLADEQVAVAQKLMDKEERARQKAKEREAKQKARDAKDKADAEQEKKEKKDAGSGKGANP